LAKSGKETSGASHENTPEELELMSASTPLEPALRVFPLFKAMSAKEHENDHSSSYS